MSCTVEILTDVDRAPWQLVATNLPNALVTWSETPVADDAGVPQSLQRAFAEAFATFGVGWYASDNPMADATKLRIKRGLRSKTLSLVRAPDANIIAGVFASPGHDWTQAAQWLFLSRSSQEPNAMELTTVAQSLYGDWQLPKAWPTAIIAIIQAAVDGDGFGLTCKDPDLLAALLQEISLNTAGLGPRSS